MAAVRLGSMASMENLGGTADVPPKELEVLMADMETRLRSTMLRVVRPALDRVTDLATRFEDMTKQVEKHEEVMYMAERLRDDVAQQGEFVKLLSDQMASRDQQQRSFERVASEGLAELRNGAADLAHRIDETQGELRKQSREQTRGWEEMQRLQQQHEDALRKAWEGITQSTKRAEKNREDVMECVRELQRQREDLLEDLFGDGKGITQLAKDLKGISEFVSPIPMLQLHVSNVRERQDELEVVCAETTDGARKQKEDFKVFAKEVRGSLGSLKNEFQMEANKLVAHHASMMKDIRWEYVEEIRAVKAIHEEMLEFRGRTEKFCHDTAEVVQQEGRRIDALHQEFVQDIEEVSKKRKKDRMSWENEVHDTKKELEKEQEMSRTLRVKVEFLSRVLGLVLEGQRVSNALYVQDFADRAAEKWLCLSSEAGRRPQDPLTVEALERQRPRKLEGKEALRPTHEMITVDFRKGLVCGEYLPGRVTFSGSSHERKDLLLAHHKLLQRAHTAYVRGPFGEEPMPPALNAVVSGQPGANGGVAAGQAAAPSRPSLKPKLAPADEEHPCRAPSWPPMKSKLAPTDEELAEPKLAGGGGSFGAGGAGAGYAGGGAATSSGARQRPGSQGQPQAMGSRGTAFGPLGETSPPAAGKSGAAAAASASGEKPLRLPSIVGDRPGSPGEGGASPTRQRSLTAR